MSKNKSILAEADEIVSDGRGYGDPVETFEHIAEIVSAIKRKEFTPDDCCLVLMVMKLVREGQFHKKDNLLDLAGYTRIMYDIKKKYNSVQK